MSFVSTALAASSINSAIKSLDAIYNRYQNESPAGTENLREATGLGFQYQIARAQLEVARASARWAVVSALSAAFGVVVAIAAVVVAAIK